MRPSRCETGRTGTTAGAMKSGVGGDDAYSASRAARSLLRRPVADSSAGTGEYSVTSMRCQCTRACALLRGRRHQRGRRNRSSRYSHDDARLVEHQVTVDERGHRLVGVR